MKYDMSDWTKDWCGFKEDRYVLNLGKVFSCKETRTMNTFNIESPLELSQQRSNVKSYKSICKSKNENISKTKLYVFRDIQTAFT